MKFLFTMMKQSIILLTLFLNTFGDSPRILPKFSDKNLTVTEKMLIFMVKKCNLRLNNTIYYTGNNSHLTEALLTTLSPVDLKAWILISTTGYIKFRNLTTIDGFVVVCNSHDECARLWDRIALSWQCIENCKVIFLFKLPNSCGYGQKTITMLGYSHYDEVYCICDDENSGPIVLTQDKYRNGRQLFWYPLPWKVDSLYPGSFYVRKSNADLCRGLHFHRIKPKRNIQILVGIKRKVTSQTKMRKDFVYSKNISTLGYNLVNPSILLLEKTLKIKFVAYIKSYFYIKGQNAEELNPFLWSSTSVDMMANTQNTVENYYIAYLHPTEFDTFIILSHSQTEATPLQKITRYYGILTLVSLIALLIITFVVIYLKTNRNAAMASFNVLRLLINLGVVIRIKTLSLKIFFCMVFLYFMVIHATFSGNLPKFLTIPEIYDTIDSLEDLSNPRISTIYDVGYYNEHKESITKDIKKKIIHLRDHYDLLEHFYDDENSVCIMDKQSAVLLLKSKKFEKKIHISKNDFGEVMSALIVRRRFFLREKFQWATTYIFDVGVDIMFKEAVDHAKRIAEREQILSQIHFRKIAVSDLKFAFIFLCIGNTLGFVCFLVELVIGRKHKPKSRLKFFKKSMRIKKQKTPIKIQRILVKPRQLEPEFNIEETIFA